MYGCPVQRKTIRKFKFRTRISKRYLFAVFFSVFLFAPLTHGSECVVLLHGLARSDKSMMPLARTLKKTGYIVVNQSYPSTKSTIEDLAKIAVSSALSTCPSSIKVNFVTHSMGGILVREYLSHHSIPELNRVVMLGPPNQGSEVVDKLAKVPGFSAINGPAGLQLGTGGFSIANELGPVEFDLGIIAGTRSINLILSRLIPGKDDGKVSVENTKVSGMNEHLAMPVTHTFMMRNKEVISHVLTYLKFGEFQARQNNSEPHLQQRSK